ncbi:PHB depolymerase family esterase [Pseudaminobacter sp. 19-2017]|uniref:PHB depolymerase family esterase n=2 Tax=Pseudaminobacter soli (ex Zhang et al. 2022) TaxID=2831468 RepID=A0A942E3Y9_9HYPH|nr:PHB depolymerase family esterase [Pseudaminobacter soli]MBS3652567.1 PHB depolymerase family esterase [Pseudaminobacter soli]
MGEVARLTKAGRLAEAMALLRRNAPVKNGPMPDAVLGGLGGKGAGKVTPEALQAFLGRFGKLAPHPHLGGLPGSLRSPVPLPDGARFEERTFSNGRASLGYKLYIPSTYKAQSSVPLVVMLHGCTQSPDDFAAGTRMNALAEEQIFLVAYPGQSQTANVSKCWNWFRAEDQQRGQGEPALIEGVTRQVMGDFSVDPKRVYVAGLSAGGAAAAIMGAAYPDLYAAVGVHSGLACGAAADLPSAFAAMRQGGAVSAAGVPGARSPQCTVPTIVFHGDNDTTVHRVNGDQVIVQAKGATPLRQTVGRGVSSGGMAYTRTVQSDESGHPVLEQWILHGAGHAWSGGSSDGSYTDPRGPDASREMLRFFSDVRMPSTL